MLTPISPWRLIGFPLEEAGGRLIDPADSSALPPARPSSRCRQQTYGTTSDLRATDDAAIDPLRQPDSARPELSVNPPAGDFRICRRQHVRPKARCSRKYSPCASGQAFRARCAFRSRRPDIAAGPRRKLGRAGERLRHHANGLDAAQQVCAELGFDPGARYPSLSHACNVIRYASAWQSRSTMPVVQSARPSTASADAFESTIEHPILLVNHLS